MTICKSLKKSFFRIVMKFEHLKGLTLNLKYYNLLFKDHNGNKQDLSAFCAILDYRYDHNIFNL